MQRAIDLLKLNLAKAKLHLDNSPGVDPIYRSELESTVKAYKKAIKVLENAQNTIKNNRTDTITT